MKKQIIDDSLIHLKKSDKVLRDLIKRIGPYEGKFRRHKNLYRPLMESVVYQQLAGKAAAAILGRFVALYEGMDFPTDQHVVETPLERLRSAGLSNAKANTIIDIARKSLDGTIPLPKDASRLPDDEIIERLTTIKGVGPWTVHMLLMKMGRPDILPITDYGIRKGFALVYNKRKLPTPKQLTAYAEAWRPYRSIACWYLWRAVDSK